MEERNAELTGCDLGGGVQQQEAGGMQRLRGLMAAMWWRQLTLLVTAVIDNGLAVVENAQKDPASLDGPEVPSLPPYSFPCQHKYRASAKLARDVPKVICGPLTLNCFMKFLWPYNGHCPS